MSNRRSQDFSPIGEAISSRARLEIDFNEQQALASRIKRTDSDLEYTPDIQPTQTDIALRGILLHSLPKSPASQRAFMSIDISENDSGRSAAAIKIADNQRHESTTYNLSPAFNIWEEWQPGKKTSTRLLENYDIMNILQNRLRSSDSRRRNDDIFEQLLDGADLTGIKVVHLLAQHLERSAKTRTSKKRYSTTDIMVSSQDYLGGVETTLTTQKTNRRIRHDLFVAAQFLIGKDNASVEKEYRYGVVSNAGPTGSIQEAGGFVTFSSEDGIPKSRLDAFAATDQNNNHPLDALNSSIDRIRADFLTG